MNGKHLGSKKKLVSFDIEISRQLPEGVRDLMEYAPLGISCAAVVAEDTVVVTWKGTPRMSPKTSKELVHALVELVQEDYTIVTWNGCKFDFNVLAQESGLYHECAALAIDHVDLMLVVTFMKGYYLGLQAALKGAGLEGKLKEVALKDGTILEDMTGKKAPELWAAGEHDVVLAYLKEDVTQLLDLAKIVEETNELRWTSRSGRPQRVRMDWLMTVRECFALSEPDVSWLDNPPRREGFISWMPAEAVYSILWN